jgi:hypothetical protein
MKTTLKWHLPLGTTSREPRTGVMMFAPITTEKGATVDERIPPTSVRSGGVDR